MEGKLIQFITEKSQDLVLLLSRLV